MDATKTTAATAASVHAIPNRRTYLFALPGVDVPPSICPPASYTTEAINRLQMCASLATLRDQEQGIEKADVIAHILAAAVSIVNGMPMPGCTREIYGVGTGQQVAVLHDVAGCLRTNMLVLGHLVAPDPDGAVLTLPNVPNVAFPHLLRMIDIGDLVRTYIEYAHLRKQPQPSPPKVTGKPKEARRLLRLSRLPADAKIVVAAAGSIMDEVARLGSAPEQIDPVMGVGVHKSKAAGKIKSVGGDTAATTTSRGWPPAAQVSVNAFIGDDRRIINTLLLLSNDIIAACGRITKEAK